jgi:signal transduction histidine kinase
VRGLRYALWPTGLALGVASEWLVRPQLVGLDAAAGFALLVLGLVGWSRRSAGSVGPVLAAGGIAWFAGTLWSPALYLHRGVLAHALISYPRLLPPGRRERAAIVAAYAYAAAYPVARDDIVTVAFAVALVLVVALRYADASGPERRARLAALAGAVAFGLALAVPAVSRNAGIAAERQELFLYDALVALVACGLFGDLLFGRWARATVTGLVVELGEADGAAPLRDRLARTLGDPTLVLAYTLPGSTAHVDELGRPIELVDAADGRAMTPVHDGGTQVATLIHDRTLLDDPELLSAVTSATRLAVGNARMQARVRARAAEVAGSRRRIVEAADEQRRRFERELRESAGQRLARVEQLALAVDPELDRQLAAARRELDEFARGIHPRALSERGLAGAVGELAAHALVPTDVIATELRFPEAVEAAAYFVCAEALANVAKHARATRASVRVSADGSMLAVVVADDGVGGADASRGSGLRGLADRVEALGGSIAIQSTTGRGTRLTVELPLVQGPEPPLRLAHPGLAGEPGGEEQALR